MNPDNEAQKSKKLSMMHTGEHIFFKALEKQVKSSEHEGSAGNSKSFGMPKTQRVFKQLGAAATKGLKLEKISLDEEESSLFVMAEGLSWDILFKAEQETNKIIKENREVIAHEIDKNGISKFSGLRIKLERIEGENVRVIEIKNHDFSACSGEHCSSTAEVKNILITKFRKFPAGYEIMFKVDCDFELFSLARTARLTLDALGTEQDKAISTIKNLKDELERCKKAMKSRKIEAKEEMANGLCFVHAVFEDMGKKILIDKANELIKDKTVLCFLNKSGTMLSEQSEGKLRTPVSMQVIIMCSADSGKDASLIVKALNQKFGGKGGGKQAFAMCSVNEGNADKVLNAVKEIVK